MLTKDQTAKLRAWPMPATTDAVKQLQALPSIHTLMPKVPKDLVVLVAEAVTLLTHERLVVTVLSGRGVIESPIHSLLMLTKSGRALVEQRRDAQILASNGEARP